MKSPIQKSAIPENRAFVIRQLIDPFFDTNWHFHQEYQLFVVLAGTGTRFMGDNIAHFQPGDMVFTGPNLPHLWRNNDIYFEKNNELTVSGIVLYFRDNTLGPNLLETQEMLAIKNLLEKGKRGLEIYGQTNLRITNMLQDLLSLKGPDSIIQLLSILNILAQSSEYKYISGSDYLNTTKETDKTRMNKVYKYLMENYRKNIELEEVAAVANMSPTAFCRYFKSRANKSFSEFVSDLRIGFACKLLVEDNINITQISYECGYNTLSNFNRQFKRIMKQTPFHYKKEYRKVM